ncbi:SGNH/GDSL hydrolase family protein [Elusimicrobiota bacterium]
MYNRSFRTLKHEEDLGMGPFRIRREVLFKIILAGGVILFAELLGHAVLWGKKGAWPYPFAMQNFYGTPQLYMSDHPYLPYLATKGRSGGVEFNSYGGRGPEPESPKSRTRILCFGGSTTFGGSPPWPVQLQKMLGEKEYEVLNAAQNGANTADTLVNLALLQVDLEPDYVLVYHGTNDLESSYYPGFRSDYAHRRRDIGSLPYPIFRKLPAFFNLSSLYVILRWELEGPRGDLHALYSRPGKAYDFENGPSGLKTFERNLRTIRAIAHEHGARLVLGTFQYYQPLAEQHFGKEFGDAWQRGINAENKIIRRIAAGHSEVGLAEVERSFVPDEESMIDFCHLKPKGTELVAKAFYRAIQSRTKRP